MMKNLVKTKSDQTCGEIKISVITIVRNGVEFIEQAITSVLMQSYRNLEYIVIDGHSTDGTVEIIKKFESGITFWKSEYDEGIADAFNKGLAASTGDYIVYLNADDKFVDSHVVEDMVAGICEHDQPALIYGDINYIDRSTERIIHRSNIAFSTSALLQGRMFPHPSLFTHRSYFDKYGSFDTSFKITMDYEWLLRGALKERVIHVPILVTNFRVGGISNADEKKVKNEIIVALKKHGYISSDFEELRLRSIFYIRNIVKSFLKILGLYEVISVSK